MVKTKIMLLDTKMKQNKSLAIYVRNFAWIKKVKVLEQCVSKWPGQL